MSFSFHLILHRNSATSRFLNKYSWNELKEWMSNTLSIVSMRYHKEMRSKHKYIRAMAVYSILLIDRCVLLWFELAHSTDMAKFTLYRLRCFGFIITLNTHNQHSSLVYTRESYTLRGSMNRVYVVDCMGI